MENSKMDMMQDAMRGAPQDGVPQDNAADAGQGTDSVLAHLSLGEVVIPRAFLDDPQVMQLLQQIFQAGGADMAQYTVGDPSNSINPETGYPEFFKWGKLLKVAAPIALSLLAPGIGTALGSSILGAGAAGASTLGSGLIGAGIGAIGGGGLKGAALGGALGGIGANIGNVGTAADGGSGILGAVGRNIPGVYDLASGISGIGDSIGGIGDSIGKSLGLSGSGSSEALSGLSPGENALISNARASLAPSSSGGLLGGLTGGSSGGGSTFGGGLNLASSLASAFGGTQQDAALKKQKEQLLAGQGQQMANLENLNPTDVQNDPGYQFAQQQGEQGLNRSLGARGSLFSGAALKEAADYNQGLASRYYGDAYQRQAAKVGAQNDIYGNTGNINANSTMAGSNNINQTLANVLGTNVGNYNGASGAQLTTQQLLELLRQRGAVA